MNAVLVIRQLKGVVVDHTQVVNDPCQTQHKATLLHWRPQVISDINWWMRLSTATKFHLLSSQCTYRDGAGNTDEENSNIFSLIWMY